MTTDSTIVNRTTDFASYLSAADGDGAARSGCSAADARTMGVFRTIIFCFLDCSTADGNIAATAGRTTADGGTVITTIGRYDSSGKNDITTSDVIASTDAGPVAISCIGK
ncbi:MAG: hypothetical protein J5478_04435 [Bacteroidales bacterium]|nr:hypothetical protein [Bacteroidales bacterium]